MSLIIHLSVFEVLQKHAVKPKSLEELDESELDLAVEPATSYLG